MAFTYLFAAAAFSLTFELLLIRTIFTVFSHSLVTSVVAVSSFGFAVGGLIYYALKKKPGRWETAAVLSFAPMFALFLFTFALLNRHGFENQSYAVPLLLSLTTLFFAGPGFFAAHMFSARGTSTAKTYACDMLGASFGALLPVIAMQFFGRELTIIIVLALMSVALSLVLWRRSPLNLMIGFPLIVAALVMGWSAVRQPWICEEFRSKPEIVNFHSDALVNINWISGQLESARRSAHVSITNEDRAQVHATYLARLDCRGYTMTVDYKSLQAVRYIEHEIHSLPFSIKNPESGAFMGTGLGMDLVRAEYFAVKKVTAFEINPYLIDLERQLLAERSQYAKPQVKVHVGDARRGLTALEEKFDLIFISSAKNYGRVGTSSGAILLNRLLTYEAIQTYWERLNDDGFLYLVDLTSHIMRTTPNVITVLKDKGLPVEGHLIYGEDGSIYSGLLLSKRALTIEQLQKLNSRAEQLQWDIKTNANFFIPNTRVVSDDRPNLARLNLKIYRPLLTATFVAVVLALLVMGWPIIAGTPQALQNSGNLLSLCLSGIIFISVQIAFLYSLELLFDRPVFTVAVTLVLMLMASAIGGLLSSSVKTPRGLTRGILALVLFTLTLLLDYFVHSVYLAPWIGRMAFAVAIIVPTSVLIGMIFPFHLSRISSHSPAFVALGVGANGLGTLLGGLMSTWLIAAHGISSLLAASFILSLFLVYTGKERIGNTRG